MHHYTATKVLVAALMYFSNSYSNAQAHKTVDTDKYPPQWVWKQGKHSSQWAITVPIQQELKRIFQPSLPDGIHATFGVAWGDNTLMGAGTPADYSSFLMLKKFEYSSHTKLIKPEGETGCWIYFQPNTLTRSHWSLPGRVDKIKYNGGHDWLFVCNLKMETDANGNRVLYTSAYGTESVMEGYCFSGNGKIPVRRLTRRELFTSYTLHMNKLWNEWIDKYEKTISTDERHYNGLTAEQKKQENYWPELIKRNQNSLAEFKQKKSALAEWYNNQLHSANLDLPAVVENLFEDMDVKKLDVKQGYHVWLDDPSFFDKTKPQDTPQFLFLKIRRQDSDLPKKLFMDRFYEAFNLDVLCNMTGEPVKRPGTVNTLNASLTTAKKETQTEQDKKGPVLINFQQDNSGSYPGRWYGMKNIVVQDYGNSKWLALSKAGYWYPRQFNKTMEDGFSLSFNLEWNKDISYYNGLFAVTLAEMEYDNVMEGFKTTGNQADYASFYDSYAVNFNRVILYFDPHFNNGGQLQVVVMEKSGTSRLSQKILLSNFYKEKNQHRLTIIRKGQQLVVKDNGIAIATVDGVFSGSASYNAYIFSRYRANNELASDTYYLNNIEVNY
jgi:hypothetical protein